MACRSRIDKGSMQGIVVVYDSSSLVDLMIYELTNRYRYEVWSEKKS